MALQFGEKDVVGDRVKGFTVVITVLDFLNPYTLLYQLAGKKQPLVHLANPTEIILFPPRNDDSYWSLLPMFESHTILTHWEVN